MGMGAADATETIPCIVKMRSNGKQINQTLTKMRVNGKLFLSQNWNNDDVQVSKNDGRQQQSHLLFRGTIISAEVNDSTNNDASSSTSQSPQSQLCAYSIQTALNEEDVSTIVDNVRFVDSAVDSCFYREVASRHSNSGTMRTDDDGDESTEQNRLRRLVFVFGPENGNPQQICQAVKESAL